MRSATRGRSCDQTSSMVPLPHAGQRCIVGAVVDRLVGFFALVLGARVLLRSVALHADHLADAAEVFDPLAGDHKAIAADVSHTVRQDVLEEPADELDGRQRHVLDWRGAGRIVLVAVVLVGERYLAIVDRDEAAVGHGDARGIAGEVADRAEPAFGAAALADRAGMGDPVECGQFVGPRLEGLGLADGRWFA